MIAFAATGYLLSFSPDLLATLEARAADAVPPELSDTVEPFIETVVEQRNAVAESRPRGRAMGRHLLDVPTCARRFHRSGRFHPAVRPRYDACSPTSSRSPACGPRSSAAFRTTQCI
jgi:hypothetical protein